MARQTQFQVTTHHSLETLVSVEIRWSVYLDPAPRGPHRDDEADIRDAVLVRHYPGAVERTEIDTDTLPALLETTIEALQDEAIEAAYEERKDGGKDWDKVLDQKRDDKLTGDE